MCTLSVTKAFPTRNYYTSLVSLPKLFYLTTHAHAVNPVIQSGSSSTDLKPPMGMVDTLQTIVREEGPRGLYRGILPNFLKVIPAVSIGYVVYERLKQILNVKNV